MGYKPPDVRILCTLQVFWDQRISIELDERTEMDWRAKKLKNSIDNAPGKINENLGHICSELQLSLSDRQARRLFKESAGISMKDYTRKRRLVFAAEQLQDTDEQLKVIATNVGYHTYQGFRKAFYEMFCLNPAEFRRFWHRRRAAA